MQDIYCAALEYTVQVHSHKTRATEAKLNHVI